ncbi:nuclear transport factor 2 family protein [Arthrobacter sp. NPDC058097]|uniref:nuclear transport factor 2 family protein n=1 Tax=Arthrobacter sp. NPDC058097 TaxID=3346340 RepID=UPI0036DA92A7
MTHFPTPEQRAILELENQRYDAALALDFDTLESLCHAELVYGHSAGNRDSRAVYLNKLRSGALRYHRIDHPVDNIVLAGDTALVIGEMNAQLTVNGTTKALNNSALAVWTSSRQLEIHRLPANAPNPLTAAAAHMAPGALTGPSSVSCRGRTGWSGNRRARPPCRPFHWASA